MSRPQIYGEPLTTRSPRLPDSWWERIERAAAHINKHSDGETPPVTMNFLFRKWIGAALQQWEAENLPPRKVR